MIVAYTESDNKDSVHKNSNIGSSFIFRQEIYLKQHEFKYCSKKELAIIIDIFVDVCCISFCINLVQRGNIAFSLSGQE